MNRNTVFLVIGMGLALIGIPLLIDWVIIGNSFPSNITNPDWVNFFGSYVGAIVGGIVSLIGIGWTIRFTQIENRADRELQIRPVFDIYCYHYDKDEDNWLGYIMLDINDEAEGEYTEAGKASLKIKNAGIGPALNISISPSVSNINLDHSIRFNNSNELVTTQSLRPGEQARTSIVVLNKKRFRLNKNMMK